MILYKSNFINNFNQDIYSNQTDKFPIRKIPCPGCHSQNSLIFYGHYKRSLYTDNEKVTINVRRCFCSQCRHSHAILPSFIIPYNALSIPDACDIVTSAQDNFENIMVRLSISLRTIRETRYKFQLYWKHLMPDFDEYSLHSLSHKCISSFELQFLQIRFIDIFLYLPT